MKLDEILKIIDTPGVVMQLHNSPDEIGAAYLAVEQARDRRDDARENLKLAEANAEAQAWMESAEYGKAKELADAKKARIAAVVASDAEAQTARQFLRDADATLAQAGAEYEKAKAQFAAVRALADIATATLNYVAAAKKEKS